VRLTQRWQRLHQRWQHRTSSNGAARSLAGLPKPTANGWYAGGDYERLSRVVLTSEVSRTLFDEYQAHRAGPRGDEEIGWLLLGVRSAAEAIVLASLPAGSSRDAGHSHVRFDHVAQTLAYRVLRQWDRRLKLLGVVHTHPGNLHRPSDADYQGDSEWVEQLPGQEGIFAIGTSDAPTPPNEYAGVVWHPRPHLQCWEGLRFSWYALVAGDRDYRPVPVEVHVGEDLAQPLRAVWPQLEAHAGRLERLAQQLARVQFEIVQDGGAEVLCLTIPLAESNGAIRVWLEEDQVRYLLQRGDEVSVADCAESSVDRAVYLILAELAADG
jgi:proteasome lid subunit RPN8/RPN11